jgi:hypothetical protein
MDEIKRDPDLEWLDHVQPVGLVVAPVLLKEFGLAPSRQTQADSAIVAEHINGEATKPALHDPWVFFEKTLGWEARHVAGAPTGPELTSDLCVKLPEHETVISPTWAVKDLGNGGSAWQLLVRVEPPGIDPDARASADGWEATAHQRFERLLRETGISAGVLVSEKAERRDGEDFYVPELRLIYAPRGETSGHLKFPLRALGTVAGRPMLGGLKLLLDSFRLFADASDRRLPALLKKSREAQAAVSTALAEQVLGALHELLRGLDAAAPDLIHELSRTRPAHLYEGLLAVLMRLVFVLYAEDRDLLPSRSDGRSRRIYETSYSLRGLFARLTEDAALNPDTMDERRGAWGRLLALFRLIHKGHPSHFVQARGGKLFDPDQFPFLEARANAADPTRVLDVSDGCCLRILEGLMTLQVRGAARERLSYRTLDVEQIGSVYETVMGFAAKTADGLSLAIRAGKNNRTPVYVDLEKMVAAKAKDRIRYLKEEADRGQLSANVAKAVEGAKTVADMAVALDAIVDERGSPKKHGIAARTPILQPTDERRRTGSHYTPRSLTEPIVRHALEPAFERLGPNATPEQILNLKVCDPAMGSGAFLVEACRALAAKLVEAWARHPEKKPKIPADEDDELHARRLVAQRCLYGVDKNPLATDLAKLSLWLATLARDHEFTFLDHALKSGDSLVGLTQAQIAAVHWDQSKPGLPLFQQMLKDRVTEAMKGRAEIQGAPDDIARAIQEQRHRSLEARLKEIRLIGDAVIAAFFAADKPRPREMKRAEVESWLTGLLEADWDKLSMVADFGLSLDQTAERNTIDGEVVGPRFFIAPELDEGGALDVTPAADIYSLGQLIFYMLTGGKRIARENVFDSRYAGFFAKGPRHKLLRLLLSKMVAPLATRYAAMDIIIREIKQIDNWEQTAASGLLDTRGLAATGKLQKRMAEEMQRKAAFDETRAQDIERIQNVSTSVSAWLFTQLEATRAQIVAGDVLIASAEANERATQRPLQVDTGSNTLLEERAYAALTVRLPNGARRRTYALQLVVCAEVQHTLPATHSNYLGVPGNPRMAVLPFFHEFSEHQPHLHNEAGYIFGKPTKFGVPDPIPIFPTPPHYPHFVGHNYQDGSMAIARFNAADWPAAQEDIVNMTRDVLSRMMQHIGQQTQ